MQNKIGLLEFSTELKIAMEDIFVAMVSQTENKIKVRFMNGQEFIVSIEEV